MVYAIVAIVALVAFVMFRKSPEKELAAKAQAEMNGRMIGDKTPTF
jgi:hypothetical protein